MVGELLSEAANSALDPGPVSSPPERKVAACLQKSPLGLSVGFTRMGW